MVGGGRELRTGRLGRRRNKAQVRDWPEWAIIREVWEATRYTKKIHMSTGLMRESKRQKEK